jgi:hypothetical protein
MAVRRLFSVAILVFAPFASFAQSPFSVTIAVQEGNWYLLQQAERSYNSFGFLGISIELKYAYAPDNSLSVKLGALTDFFLPFPAAWDPGWAMDPEYTGDFKTSGAIIFAVRNETGIAPGWGVNYGFHVSKKLYRYTSMVNGKVVEESSLNYSP